MQRFQDKTGHEWAIQLDAVNARAVYDLLKVDLLNPETVFESISSAFVAIDVCYILCKAQCEDRKMTDIDFGKAFDGDTLDGMRAALVGAVIDFFPSKKKTVFQKLWNQTKERYNAPLPDNLDEIINQSVEGSVAQLSGDSTTNTAESSDSTPSLAE